MSEVRCAYCDRRLGVFSKHVDRILPKSLYTQLKGLKYLHGVYKVKLDDQRNLTIACKDCIRMKGEDMLVPTWHEKGFFMFFTNEELRSYADFFYIISYPLMHMFREAIPAPGAEESMVAVELFRNEYEWRKNNDAWEIGFPFIEEHSYETYRKSAMESRCWW